MIQRHRRLRAHSAIRDLVRETTLCPKDFIYPIFVVEGENRKEEIGSMPGNYHYSIDRLHEIIKEIVENGIRGVLLFGVPDACCKDEVGTAAWIDDGIVQRAVRKIKELTDDIMVITDICMCQFTDHGHCGIVQDGLIVNDDTLPYLGAIALSHAKAGADMVAPSDMMDGRVRHIREQLDQNGYDQVAILSYSAKYASSFYGPFRDAAHSAPQFGDRRTYQMDPGNARQAMSEIAADIQEGADMVMVKPALSYLDVIRWARDRYDVPVAAYSVSGEFAMIKAAAEKGIIDERAVAMETLLSIKRAGADIIISYYAIDACKWLRDA